jgi:hypothetical protein
LVGCQVKTPTAGTPGWGSHRRSHGELDASIVIKPTAAFNHGDTFVFGSWVCTADSARSFQRYLTMTPDPETGLVMLPEVVTGPLAEKFCEFSLYNQVTDFKIGSDSNSNSASPWIKSHEPAPEPSCGTILLHEHFSYDLCNSSRTHAEALAARRAGKEIVSRTPTPYPATTRTPPTSLTLVQTQSSPSPRSTRPRNRCQVSPLAWSLHPLPPVESSTSLTTSPQT